MQGREVLALAGLRVDGRRHNEIRHIKCRLGVAPDADGSVYLEQVSAVVCFKAWLLWQKLLL